MFILKAQETDEVYDLPLANRREPAHASWVNRWYTCTCMYVCIYDMHIYAHVCICVHVSGRRKKEMNVINIHLFFGCATWHLSWLGIKPMPPALGAQSLNHRATRVVPQSVFLTRESSFLLLIIPWYWLNQCAHNAHANLFNLWERFQSIHASIQI